MREITHTFTPENSDERVSAILQRPEESRWLLVLAHGAGAGMHHRFLEAICDGLAARSVATFRYQFPYMEAGRRMPDRAPRLIATVRAAVDTAREIAGDLPIFAGGKSLGGRMTSMAAAEDALAEVRGIVFFGFPLHPADRPSTDRAEHLHRVTVPMLFLQGTRDALAGIDEISEIVQQLGRGATLHVVEGADHSFGVLKRSGRTDDDVNAELADAVVSFMRRHC